MATTISKLAILLSLNSEGVTSGVTNGIKQVDRLQGNVHRLGSQAFAGLGRMAGSSLAGVASSFAAPLGAAVLLHQTVDGIASAFERVAERAGRASQLGASVQELGGLEFAISQGSNLEGADGTFDALRAFNKRISDAKDPANELAKALDRIGLSAAQLEKLSLTDRVRTIGEAIRQIPAAEDRAAVSAKFFEETGSNIVALFNKGDDAILDLIDDYDRLHGVISSTDVENMRQSTEAMGRLWTSIEGSFERIAADLGPDLAEAIDSIAEAVVGLRGGFDSLNEFTKSWNNAGVFQTASDIWKVSSAVNPGLWPIHWMFFTGGGNKPGGSGGGMPDERTALSTERMAKAAEQIADSFSRSKDHWADMRSDAHQLTRSLMTPLETLDVELLRIKGFLANGFIDETTFARAEAQAREKFKSATARSDQAFRRDVANGPVGLAERGSVAAFSAERAGKNELKTIADNSRKQVELDEKAVEELEEQTRLFRETGEFVLKFEPIL